MKKKFILEGLDCANCAAKIERAINEISGVNSATLSFITKKLVIDGEDEKIDEIIKESEKIIGRIEPDAVLKKA
jgi:copper chaperone CopZ